MLVGPKNGGADGWHGHVGKPQDAQGHFQTDCPQHVIDGRGKDDGQHKGQMLLKGYAKGVVA